MGMPIAIDYTVVLCDVCGSKVGVRCVAEANDGSQRVLPPGQSHKARKDAYAAQYMVPLPKNETGAEVFDKAVAEEGARIEAEIEAEDEHDRLLLEAREGRIRLVLTAIAFSRKIGTTQDQLDRNMAEMIVDAEFDHELLEG